MTRCFRTGHGWWIVSLAAGLAFWCGASAGAADSPREFRFHRDNVLGTSLDTVVVAPNVAKAEAANRLAVNEIQRLARLLNSHDPTSEIGRLNAADGAIKCSPELLEVLDACEQWRRKSGGAFNAHLARVIELWKQAQQADALPPASELAARLAEAARPVVEIDKAASTARRTSDATLNVDALAKGYVIDRALAAAIKADGVDAVLLDIGGDVRTWSRDPGPAGKSWIVGVADPAHPADNAPPKARLLLRNAALATSGNYERFYTVKGKKHSHIIDPRTGLTADRIASATAVAEDCATADALATALSVLSPQESLRLVASIKGAECLIIEANGAAHASAGWGKLLAPDTAAAAPTGPAKPAASAGESSPTGWPSGYQMTFQLNLKRTWSRPYVAIWVEDASGKAVRTLAVWGRETKYLRQMRSYWKHAGGELKTADTVSRASRSGGKYSLVWDGKDDHGKAVPQGRYVVRLELYRKEGKRFDLSGSIDCDGKPARGSIADSPEVSDMTIRYDKEN